MGKRPTIKTIAELAGVSHVAVSRALRGAHDISPETTERIHRIAREVGYTPNAFARNLSSRRSGGLGMILPAMGDSAAYNVIFDLASKVFAEHGYCVYLGSSNHDVELEHKYCRMMCENQAGALIVAPVSDDVAQIKDLCGPAVPVIFIGGDAFSAERYAMVCGHRRSAELAAEHLHSLGHRRVALLGRGRKDPTYNDVSAAFAAECDKLGLECNLLCSEDDSGRQLAGRQLAAQLMAAEAPPTGIWCLNNAMAAGVMEAFEEKGAVLGRDVSVLGRDNSFPDSCHRTDLSSLDLPWQDIAAHTVQLALLLMDELKGDIEPVGQFEYSLVSRGSTGPLG